MKFITPAIASEPMPPLAVDQHQRVIGRQAAQIGGPNDCRRIRNRLHVDVVRRDDIAQQVLQVRVALVLEIIG
jgi:hypothetical protein